MPRLRRDPVFADGLRTAADEGRVIARVVDNPYTSPFDPCVAAVAEWRARGMFGLRNRHFRKRTALEQIRIKLDWSMRR